MEPLDYVLLGLLMAGLAALVRVYCWVCVVLPVVGK